MQENLIVVEIIMLRASSGHIAQQCSGLTNNFYTQNALANTLYTFDWGAGTEIKIAVGGTVFLLEYVGSVPEVRLIGTCGTTDWENFNISDQTLYYNDSVNAFEIQFVKHGLNNLAIKVLPNSNTTIDAYF